MEVSLRRRGVASVLGTVFFVLVFMLALGSLAYASGLQAQASAAQQHAEQADARRGGELLTFSKVASGLQATDGGPTTVVVNHVVLKFPNGTVYPLVASVAVPAGGTTSVQSLIPAGVCSPGSATCLSKYTQIVAGNPTGSSVGLVTSMGNSFWYTFSGGSVPWTSLTQFPKACPPGQSISKLNTTITCSAAGAVASWAKSPVSTSGTNTYGSTSLSVALSPNGTYAFYAFTAIEPTFGVEQYNFEVHALPAGASLVIACTPMADPVGGGNQPTHCVTTAGTPIATPNTLGFGVSPPVFATPGVFGMVTVGATGGTLQIDFACTANCGALTIQAGSFLLVQPVG